MASSSNTTSNIRSEPTNASQIQPTATTPRNTVTPLQWSLAAVILGASAGLTLYTKKTSHMLSQFERASKNAQQRRGPPQFGPKTRMEWEKTRNRWEKDDL
ncbi:hypothetical protein HJC23_008336 [Cyclotella cryptica]|uniref:Uncharacterized protein n=1 Tax=Cyclotella cryptica TaxID=29204 RepID=A0ABD3Q5B8_9STRA|eukprot:CCRYP_008619-RA/>CCRYP_008619-RA protein AED:0.48 eAED:0.48 QI:0/-1/0/1/-1/1/1/0/100